jgi:thioredoxin reductase (NADPH)
LTVTHGCARSPSTSTGLSGRSLPGTSSSASAGIPTHGGRRRRDVELDARGFVATGPDLTTEQRRTWPLDRDPFFLETSVPGIFAAGDVRSNSIKRVASAVGEGAMAVTLVHRYLSTG